MANWFYIYSYFSSDTTNVDTFQINKIDSLAANGPGTYSKIVVIDLSEYACFFVRAARKQGNLKLVSPLSNRTIFVKEPFKPTVLGIP
jgi:hypothetical protein